MQARKFRVPQRKTQRRWRVPPALKRGDEIFEGLGVLDELTGERGLVLWQSLRDALLWADAQEDERAALFSPDAERTRMAMILASQPAPELEEPLSVMARMLGEPTRISEEMVALACRRVSQWSDDEGLLATSLAFAQAAATVTPGDPATAFAVGKLARRRAEYARAETWFRRTIALARQVGDWATYAQAFNGLGNLYRQRGNLPAARRFLARAVRAAQRNSLHAIEGAALHDWFVVATEGDRTEEAQQLARAAFEAYGPHHPRIPMLAQDVAYWWTTQGYHGRALPVLRSTLPHFTQPHERLNPWGSIARAAGGIGDRAAFREAWDACYDLLPSMTAHDVTAQTLLDMALGAASLGIWDKAEQAAREALEIGSQRQEGRIRLTAEAVLDSVRHHRSVETNRATARPEMVEAGDSLAAEFVRSLQSGMAAV
ncbi:MAG TPA: tetratricopeptide repeat protein [Longimicrobium sp.]|jgi:tetratricopeptide (TPR) repeat protein|uniref:tetratricopeptide repeat protein n=1 Tax=Longimicrobium sp. TaxID=2029185 RepID=UPI002ED87183